MHPWLEGAPKSGEKMNGHLRESYKHYGPDTWDPNEFLSGAREPIYNLNWIIKLQAVFEIITKTATALDLLADQSTQMRN